MFLPEKEDNCDCTNFRTLRKKMVYKYAILLYFDANEMKMHLKNNMVNLILLTNEGLSK